MTIDTRAQAVDALFTQWAKSDSPGCTVAIMQDGEMLYKQGYGMANLEYNIPNRPDTIYHVASVSKQFTTAAILMLESDGKLSIEDDVRQYIPELHDFGDTIQIQHLIHHTSGLRDQWNLLVAAGWRMDDVITIEDALGLISAQRELNFKPGDAYTYCNSGYTLMAIIVERVSGKSLRQFCAERIFEPLGMTRTHFHDNYQEIVRGRAYSYSNNGDGFKHAHLMYSNVGPTSLFTTVEDLMLWGQNYLEPKVGGEDWTARMTEHGMLNDGEPIAYASGVLNRPHRGVPTIEHSGGDAGFRTHFATFPDQKLSVAVFANLGSIRASVVAMQVADIYLSDAIDEDATEVMALSSERLQELAGLYYNESTTESLSLEYKDDDEAEPCLTLYDLKMEAIAEDRLRLAIVPGMTFQFDENGLTVNDNIGRPVTYTKIERATPSAEALAAYAGIYFSPELDVPYTITLKDDHLVLTRRKYGSQNLSPTAEDAFLVENNGGSVFFTCDDAGNVSGLNVTNGRVRHLHFVREE